MFFDLNGEVMADVQAIDVILAVLWTLVVARIYMKKGLPGILEQVSFIVLFAATLTRRCL